MVVYGIGCDSIKPVSKLSLGPPKMPEVFNNLEKYYRGNIFCCLPFKKSVYTIAKYSIVMPAIQLNKLRRVSAGVGVQLTIVRCLLIVIHANLSFSADSQARTNYHHYYKCAQDKNVAGKKQK
jgi:hypothetical protein